MATTSTPKRIALTAGAAGLVAGLALGATGLAGAAVAPAPGTTVVAAEPGQRHPGAARKGVRDGAGGLVTAITASSLTVRTARETRTFGLTDSTTYYAGKEKASRAAVSVGDRVRVRLADPKGGAPVASTVVVLPAHLAGWVTALNGDLVTITDRQGFTRTVRTSPSTTVSKDGAVSALGAITAGGFLRALGEVANDGTTLNAKRIILGAPEKGPRGPGHRRPAPDEMVSR